MVGYGSISSITERGNRTCRVTAVSWARLGVYMALKYGHACEKNTVIFHRLIRENDSVCRIKIEESIDDFIFVDVYWVLYSCASLPESRLGCVIETCSSTWPRVVRVASEHFEHFLDIPDSN